MIWVIFAVLTAAAIAILIWPAARNSAPHGADDRNAFDRTVFRDQLAELDRDIERGVIGHAEADAARNEIARRLIAAGDTARGKPKSGGRSVALVGALLVPAIALPLYLVAGSPDMPDVPLAQRIERAAETGDFEALIVQVEQHLTKNPDDIQGWKVLAPAYSRAERWPEAADAYRNIVRLGGRSAEALSDLGEALVLANGGLVTADAHKLFIEALAQDAKLPKARFFDAVALKQEGKMQQAKAAFDGFLADTPPDAPWRSMLLAEIKDMEPKAARAPALDEDAMDQAANMSAADRQAMIRSMVDGLEEKLKADGTDLEGWLRLIRARAVLGEADRAKTAYTAARQQFKDNPQGLAQLDGLAREMNIQ